MAEESANGPPPPSPHDNDDEFEADPTADPNFAGNQSGSGGGNKTLIIGVVLLVVIAIVVGVVVGVSGGDDDDDKDLGPLDIVPTAAPTTPSPTPPTGPTEPKTDEEYFLNLVTTWSGGAPLTDPQSPQSLALQWILEEDGFGLTQYSKVLDIQQRYTMAVFYHSTKGQFWSDRKLLLGYDEDETKNSVQRNLAVLDFLSDGDVCGWNDGQGDGVLCDDATGEIQHLVLST
jgi:hypothetical protein